MTSFINILNRNSEILKYRVTCFYLESVKYYKSFYLYDPNFMKLIDKI